MEQSTEYGRGKLEGKHLCDPLEMKTEGRGQSCWYFYRAKNETRTLDLEEMMEWWRSSITYMLPWLEKPDVPREWKHLVKFYVY